MALNEEFYEDDEPASMEFETEEDFENFLIDMCIIEEAGFDDDGEILYQYNFARLKELMPELYEEIMAGLNDRMLNLFNEGLVSVEYDEDLVPHFVATPEGMEFFNKQYGQDSDE